LESKKEQIISPTATPAGSDNRYETCSQSDTAYPHDIIHPLNFSVRAACMVAGMGEPWYLARSSKRGRCSI